MLMLSLTSRRARCAHPEIAALIDQGDIARAIDVGRSQVERELPTLRAADRAPAGQLLGRCLLMTGREEDAEDLFRRLARTYGEVSRAHVRWLSGLDQGVMLLHLNRPSRAAESFCAVADDPAADVALRVEAMAGAAVALHRAGDCRSASRSLAAARRLCAGALDAASAELVDGIGLELAALQRSRSSRPMDDHAMHDVYCEGTSELATLECLRSQLLDAAARFEARMPMVARRLRSLAHATGPAAGSAQLIELLSWVRARRLAGLEPELRVESAMLMMASGAVGAAAEVLSPQIGDEIKLRRSRHAVDLHYLMSRLSLSQGRAADALRWYRSHSQEAIRALSGHGSRRLATSYLHVASTGEASADEAARARLPLRYRRAHQFILDHLHDENLSVQRVAVELGVTERALQMAFRNHLGLTPTEFIRTRRVERVHEDLVNGAGDHDLMQLAQRHGIRNRSTLSSNYRSRFAETPMQTLRGGAGTVRATVT